jgi:hypothetical protein
MPHLNLDLSFFTHRKTCRLVGLLGRGAEVLLLRLWCHCGAHHCEDGRLTDYSPNELESMAGWWGRQGEMVAAMIKIGFIEPDGDGFRVHDWLEHQGHLAAFRAKGRAMAQARWQNVGRNAASITVSNAADPPLALPEPTEPTEPVPRTTPTNPRPKNLAEVLTIAEMRGFLPLEAERFWDHFEASGWIDKNGHPVLKWENKLATWCRDARARPAEANHHSKEGGPSVADKILHEKELTRVEKRIGEIQNAYDSHREYSQKDKESLSGLHKRKKELKAALGFHA